MNSNLIHRICNGSRAAHIAILATVLFGLTVTCAFPIVEIGSPDWIVETFFKGKDFPEKTKYYTGEMFKQYLNTPPMGAWIPENVHITYRILDNTDNALIYAVQYTDGTMVDDWYCFINKEDGNWKLKAVRTLATTGPLVKIVQDLSQKTDLTEQEKYYLHSATLTISSDASLKQYFKEHKAEFDDILYFYRKYPELLQVKSDGSIDINIDNERLDFNMLAEKIRKLGLNYVGRQKDDKTIIDFSIGGILENSVGYLFVPRNSKKPCMSPNNYIYLEEIYPCWYIYKTT